MTTNGSIVARSVAAALLAALLAASSVPTAAQEAEGQASKASPLKNLTPSEMPTAEGKGAIRLPDGTWLWVGNEGSDDRVSLPWKEYVKLLAELEQRRKQSQSRKPITPSLCAIRIRIEKRGEQSIAVARLSNSFRTTASQTSVLLGGRKGLLTAATLDGVRLPVLESSEEGYLATVETAGEHTLVLDLETPITPRGGKGEVGFEIGLPRAAITTLQVESTGLDIPRLNLVTRWSDPSQPSRPPEVRRLNALDIRQFASAPGQSGGYPLGPVESLEVTWDPPARTPAADRIQTAEWDITVTFSDTTVETVARVTLRGTARQWRIAAPSNALLHAERPLGSAEIGPGLPPAIQRSGNKAEWQVEFPPGSMPADWVLVASMRTPRPRSEEAGHRGPFSVGPFAALNVFRQTGILRLVAGPYMRFAVRHSSDLRRQDAPASDEERTTALFRLTSGPTGTNLPTQPLATVEVHPVHGSLVVTPHYQATFKSNGWHIETKLKVEPIRREVDALVIEVPPEWRGVEAGPPDIVEGIQSEVAPAATGFWQTLAHRIGYDPRLPLLIRLANTYKQPVQFTLTATLPLPQPVQETLLPLPRFPGASTPQTRLHISVPDDLQVQGQYREWLGGRAAATGVPLQPIPRNDSKSGSLSQLQATSEQPIAAVQLHWKPYRPDLAVDSRAEITLTERQILIQQAVQLHTNENLPRSVHLQGFDSIAGLSANPALEPAGPGQWRWTLPPESREARLTLEYALPRSPDQSRLPIRLFRVGEATRGDHLVRLWSATAHPELIRVRSSHWRERPLEALADRAVWPLRVLSAPQEETLLELEVEPRQDMAVSVWVERGLIQVWAGEDLSLRYRTRFRLRRWLARSLTLELPASTTLSTEFFLDGRRVEPLTVRRTDQDTALYQLPLPAYRPASRLLLEVRYVLSSESTWRTVLVPPVLSGTAWDGPTWWRVTLAGGQFPWLQGSFQPRWRWSWQSSGIALTAWSEAELEQLLMGEGVSSMGRSGSGNDETGAESFSGQHAIPTPFILWRLPHWPVMLGSSLLVFIYLVFLSRLSPVQLSGGVIVTVLLLAAWLALAPYSLLQLFAAGQLGLYSAVVMGLIILAQRWYRQRQILYLPGFSRDTATFVPTPDSKVPLLPAGSRRGPTSGNSTPVGRLGVAPPTPSGNH